MRQPRHCAGTPIGGQFATKSNPEADFELDWIPGDDDLVLPADDITQVVPVTDPSVDPSVDPPVDESIEPEDRADHPAIRPDEAELAGARAAVAALLDELKAPSGRSSELAAAAEAEIVIAGQKLARRINLLTLGLEQDGVAKSESRQQATVAVLSRCRPLGLPDGQKLDLAASSQKPAAKLLNQVSSRFPRAWLASEEASRRHPLSVRVGTGRHHYAPSRGKWEKIGVDEHPMRYEDYPVAMISPNARDVEYRTTATGEQRASWTVMRRSARKALTAVAEITVPSPTRWESSAERVATHELMHRMEDTNSHINLLERTFLNRRCVDEHGNPTPARSYQRSRTERVREGGFVDEYVGKVYNQQFTEVMSMGTEAVLTGSYGGLAGNDMYKADADHRAFVLGMLAVA